MKKIFKKTKIGYLIIAVIFLITGVVIGGVVGVTATTNKLEAKYVMYTKDGKTMTVQDAIKDLYVLANNKGGSNQTLPLGDITVSSFTIKIPYMGTYKDIKCVYGTNENYGSKGTISGNTCNFTGTNLNQKLYYKIIASNDDGKIYENNGSVTTGSESNVIVTDIPTGTKAIIYLDPTDLTKKCNQLNSTVGGTAKSGCMKWYAFKEDDTSYTMLLDHNTTAKVAWNSDNINTSMKEVQTELNNLVNVTKWEVTPRLIHAQEIANITGKSSIYSFRFDSNCSLRGECSIGENKYYWLFDYTNNCIENGCKVADSSTAGHWTDTPESGSPNHVWCVTYDSDLYSYSSVTKHYGVRPVITVQKSNF